MWVSPRVPLSVVTLEPSRFKGDAALALKAFRQADMHTAQDERIGRGDKGVGRHDHLVTGLQVEQQLTAHALFQQRFISGLRIPGLWCQWEAGVRAVLGQQVSVAGARTQLNRLVQALGVDIGEGKKLFPPPEAVATSDLQMIKVPQARRETLKALANYVIATPDAAPETWLSIKGIGPWTINYARMRGLSDSDIWLGGDLGVQKALAQHNATANGSDSLAPWRSYATLQLWFSLGD